MFKLFLWSNFSKAETIAPRTIRFKKIAQKIDQFSKDIISANLVERERLSERLSESRTTKSRSNWKAILLNGHVDQPGLTESTTKTKNK